MIRPDSGCTLAVMAMFTGSAGHYRYDLADDITTIINNSYKALFFNQS